MIGCVKCRKGGVKKPTGCLIVRLIDDRDSLQMKLLNRMLSKSRSPISSKTGTLFTNSNFKVNSTSVIMLHADKIEKGNI